ncbi:hypothetical protein ACFFHI_28670 [Streptomyces palmae]|uniref:Uncharacterized protein n=1 Tax=Streptomyces palmae TaxID=1701085 RepID=A0A4Z0FUM0_9ACTN|nr:hypothetical protein E4099_30730 [Streptomyces palmae]
MTHNPGQHAKVAADAVARLVQEVRAGRAAWEHPHTIGATAEEAARLCESLAIALQELAGAWGRCGPRGPRGDQAIGALHQAGQSTTAAARHLRRARQTMR